MTPRSRSVRYSLKGYLPACVGALLAFSLGCSSKPTSPNPPASGPSRPIVLWGPGGKVDSPTLGHPRAERGKLCPQLAVDGHDRVFISSYFPLVQEDLGDRVLFGRGFWGQIQDRGGIAWVTAHESLRINAIAASRRSPGFSLLGEEPSGGERPFHLTSFDETGQLRWTRASELYARDLIVDEEGNTITISDWGNPNEAVQEKSELSKYNNRGQLLWRKYIRRVREGGLAGHEGSIYVTYNAKENDSRRLFLSKHTSAGVEMWQREIARSEHIMNVEPGWVDRLAMELDHFGNLYLMATFFNGIRVGDIPMAGPVFTSLSSGDKFLAKIDDHGNVLYARHIPGDRDAMFVHHLALDERGRPWITGLIYGQASALFPLRPPALPQDYEQRHDRLPPTHFIARFDPDGHVEMATEVARGGPRSMVATRSGTILLTTHYTGELALKGAVGARPYDYGKFGCAVLRIPIDYNPRAFDRSRRE